MSSVQRVVGIVIVILALVIAIVPALYNCSARGIYMHVTGTDSMGPVTDDGKAIGPDEMVTGSTVAGGMTATTMAAGAGSGSSVAPMAQGMTVPMKCFYSAKAATGIAIPVGILGLLLLVARRKETNRALAIMGIALGAVVMAVPALVGTCGSASAICNEVLKPTMLLAGGLVIVLSVVVLVLGERRRESTV